ncbi:unnamed protein product, partial [Prorocentrum cordatum]
HPLIQAARQELATLEAEERRAQPPEQLLVSLQKRVEEARASASQVADDLVEAIAKVDDLRRQQGVADVEVKNLEVEVQAAQRAVAASAASSSGADLAALASTLVGLQATLASAPARVASGQGITVLEAIGQQELRLPPPPLEQEAQQTPRHLPRLPLLRRCLPVLPMRFALAGEPPQPPGKPQARPTWKARHRGRRGSARVKASFVTYNGSSWASRREFLTHCDLGIQVVAAQELRIDGDDRRRAEGWAARAGWHAIIPSCRRLESGRPSAGVGLFIRRHISVTMLPGLRGFDLIPSFCVACHADLGIKGGLVLLSCYIEVGRWNDVNVMRLYDIATALRGWNRPFLAAGDFNCDPKHLLEYGFLDFIPAAVVASPPAPTGRHPVGTCRSAQGAYSTIDYWLASLSIAGSLALPHPVEGWPASPHFPMLTSLDARAKAVKFLVLRAPKAFPKAAPTEDVTPVLAAGSRDLIEDDVALGGAASPVQAQARLDRLYAEFVNAVEE